MSTSIGKCAVEHRTSITGKAASTHSEKWSRSSSLTRSKADEKSVHELETAESEFHLASCDLDEQKDCLVMKESPPASIASTTIRKSTAKKASSSGIPLLMNTKTVKTRQVKPGKPSIPAKAVSIPSRSNFANRHTLEVQFLNKSKRFSLLKKELVGHQKPVIEMYQSLIQIKKKLAELGKCVKIDEIKFLNFGELQMEEEKAGMDAGDAFNNAKTSIEQIPQTLMDVCKNLLSRRAAIVDLLETVSKTDFDSSLLGEKVRSLKVEGGELQKSLDAIIVDHEKKIEDLVKNWQRLIRQQTDEANHEKVDDLEFKLKCQEKLVADSQQVITDLQKKLDDKKSSHDRVIIDLELLIKKHEEKIRKLESDIENEKKVNGEHKNRNAASVQTIKSLKGKIADLESKHKEAELKTQDMSKKLTHAHEQMRVKESLWAKEKEELNKNIKNQENLLAKLTSDRNHFETRFRTSEEKMSQHEKKLMHQLEVNESELKTARNEIQTLKSEKSELENKCAGMEDFLKKMSDKNKEQLQFVTSKIDWGKTTACSEAELLSEVLSLKVELRNYEDKVKDNEEEIQALKDQNSNLQQEVRDNEIKHKEKASDDPISRYQHLLEESEKKLNEKCRQISTLQAEIRHLKMRQNVIDEQNENCPTSELVKMVNEGKSRMSDLIRKSMENDQRLHEYEAMVEKQQKQMLEMENLLKMRNGLLGVMKSKKDELQLEKESLTRYSNEMRTLLFGIKEDLQQKAEQIQDLSEKLESKERTCSRLEKKITELEENLAQTNEQRFKLQDTISLMEKELQTTKAHLHKISPQSSEQRYEFRIPSPNIRQSYDQPPPSTPLAMEAFKAINLFNYQPQFMSQSLYGLSMKNICSIRARVEEINNNIKVPLERRESINSEIVSSTISSASHCTHCVKKIDSPFEKMLQLKAKRCEILQQRADQSHDDLNDLIRLLTPAEKPLKDTSKTHIQHFARESTSSSTVSRYSNNIQPSKFSNNLHKFSFSNHNLHRTKSCQNSNKYGNSSQQTLKDLTETIENLKKNLRCVEEKMMNDPYSSRLKFIKPF